MITYIITNNRRKIYKYLCECVTNTCCVVSELIEDAMKFSTEDDAEMYINKHIECLTGYRVERYFAK